MNIFDLLSDLDMEGIVYSILYVHFIAKVIQRLDSENMRSRRFLHSSSYELVTRECQQRMVGDLLQMLYAECHDMVKKERSKGK